MASSSLAWQREGGGDADVGGRCGGVKEAAAPVVRTSTAEAARCGDAKEAVARTSEMGELTQFWATSSQRRASAYRWVTMKKCNEGERVFSFSSPLPSMQRHLHQLLERKMHSTEVAGIFSFACRC
jgi:hypothetical protein